jgi:hypothetical protein
VVALERLGLAIAVPILVAGVIFTPRWIGGADSGAPVSPVPADIALSADAREPAADAAQPDAAADGLVDLYGNEVTDAIATYTFDQTGSLYELHSPQTELPRLATPKT